MCCLIEPEWDIESIEGPDSITGVLKVLEPDAGKLARPVLRGGGHGNVTFLPDNRQTKETANGLILYEYDDDAKLRKANDVIYDYDTFGNLTKKISPHETSIYSYNELGQLAGFENEDYNIEFTYNGQGERLSKTVNGQITEYTYEDVFPVFQLLQEKKGKNIRQHFYGHSCLGYLENNKAYYYLEESPGNPVGIIVDEKGVIVEELEYDAFGKCLSSSDASVQFNGEQVDVETGLIFLRTRYYDPEMGRFLSPDRIPGNPFNPQSLNRYVYVNNNPLNFRDPMGTVPEPKRDAMQPHSWAKGVPIWQEGDPLPPEGMTLVAICARKRGLFVNDPTRPEFFRPRNELEGHGWLEFIHSDGTITSTSTHKGQDSNTSTDDFIFYANDRDTIKIGYLVPNIIADQIKKAAESFSQEKYGLLCHNCVHATATGAAAGGLEELFYELKPTYSEDSPSFSYEMKTTPSSLYSAIKQKVDALIGLEHPLTSLPQLNNEILWMHLASDDPYCPSLYPSAEALKLQNQYFQSPSAPQPKRGNFGGISLSKRAEMKLDLKEIYGAVYDEKTQQVILIGQKAITLPEMRLDDLAVAIQSVYGLRGSQAEDPGVSIEPAPDSDELIVRYLGATFGTEFGKVLFDADYTLKMLFLGRYPCHVPGFLSFMQRRCMYEQIGPYKFSARTWIIPEQISLAQSTDGSAMFFETVKMRCFAETMAEGQRIAFPPHEAFAQHFTDNYDAIAVEYPVFTEVKRLGQIAGVVKWLKDSHIPFDLSFFKAYGPNPCSTPLSTAFMQEEAHHSPDTSLTLKGGIDLLLNSQNFAVRQEEEINSLKEDVVLARPSEQVFSWELEDSDRQTFTAEALPLFKTRKTGDFRKTFVDLQFPVPGDFPLTLSRFYDSFNDLDIGFGIGWSIAPFELILTDKIAVQTNETPFLASLVIIAREGNQHWIYNLHFRDQEGKSWYLREDKQQILCENTDHGFSLLLKEGGVVSFNEQGQLTCLLDRNEIKTEYGYTEGRLIAIQHQNGKTIHLKYEEGRIVEAFIPNGPVVRYGYDDKNQLAQISNTRGKLQQTYRYDTDLRLTHIMTSEGNILFEGGYDEYNRLSSIRIGEKELKKDYSLAECSSTLISPDGIEIEGKYDQNYCLIGHKALGHTQWETLFEEDKSMETTFDQDGKKEWEYTRDLQGLLKKAVDPKGNTWKFFYNPDGKLLLKEDPKGDKTCFQYNKNGFLELKLEHAENVTYDEVNKTISATCAKEYRTRYMYNPFGRIRVLAVGYDNTTFDYDENGLLKEVTLPSGYTLKREFDEDLRVKSLADGGGVLTSFEYDEEGRLKVETSPAGCMEYGYNEAGKISKITDRCGNVTEFEYNERGNLSIVKDAEGFSTKYSYFQPCDNKES